MATASAQTLERSKLIVSYSYNFAKHIQWPNESTLQSFTIGLFRVEDLQLVNEFKKLNNITIKNLSISVKQTSRISSLNRYNAIFVGDIDNKTLAEIQSIVEGKPILLITNDISDKRLVMINLLKKKDQQVKFEINKANILNSQLNPRPELILLGGTEIDVAKLYRDGQSSLIKLEQQLASQKTKLTAQQNTLKLQKKQLDLQQKNLNILIDKNNLQETSYNTLLLDSQQLNKDITDTKILNHQLLKNLAILKSTITSNKQTIKKQNDEIENSEKQKNKLTALVHNSNQQLSIQQQNLEKKQQELSEKNQALIDQKNRLNTISTSIRKKEDMLSTLNRTIDTQKRSLYFLWGIIALVIALFLLAFIAYRSKRKDNQRLAQKSHDLQIAQNKLTVAKQRAEEANQAKGVFLSLMSHELRTPLQSIMGYTALVIEELESEGNNTYTDPLGRVISNSERLLTLINNTLDLAKIEAGKMGIQLTNTNISSLLEDALSNTAPLLNKSKNQLSVNIDNRNITSNIDYEKVLHMLVNLLSNAIKFTKDGNIDITVNNHKDYLRISVSDTGIGLSDKQLKTIFYQFQQANNKDAVKVKGTGLGLSITKHFCELMGGTISVDSQENIGTSFIINIPLPVTIRSKKVLEIE